MGKTDVIHFLKANTGKYFSAEDVSRNLEVNIKTSNAILKKLLNEGDLLTSEVTGRKGTGHVTKVYAYRSEELPVQKVIKEIARIKSNPENEWVHSETIAKALMIVELRRLNEEMRQWKIQKQSTV